MKLVNIKRIDLAPDFTKNQRDICREAIIIAQILGSSVCLIYPAKTIVVMPGDTVEELVRFIHGKGLGVFSTGRTLKEQPKKKKKNKPEVIPSMTRRIIL